MMTYKKLLIIFIIGILFVGIGAGVCVMEFGSYKYMGEKEVKTDTRYETTDSFNVELEGKDGKNEVLLEYGLNMPYVSQKDGNLELIVDNRLPENRIRIEITYDSRYFNASVSHSYISSFDGLPLKYNSERDDYYYYDEETGKYYSEEEIEETAYYYYEIYMELYRSRNSLLNYMELALDDLKNKEIYDYNAVSNVKVKVYAAADTLSHISY